MNNQIKNYISIYLAGHFSIDIIKCQNRFQIENKPTIGGSVSFGSLSLRAYTQDVKISIISNLGRLNFEDSLLDLVKNKNIDLRGLKWFETDNTNFVLNYFSHSRTLTLKSRSSNLEFKDIPEEYLNNPPDIIVLVPLCNEISYEYVAKILQYFPNAYIGIDPQGFIRKIDGNGKVSYVQDKEIIYNMIKIMNLIGDRLILKGSEVEMKLLSKEDDLYEVMKYFSHYKGLFIMTLGEAGSMIVKKGKEFLKIPAFMPGSVVDETGAGDVYFAIFLYEYICSDKSWKSIEKSAYLASSAASFNVEKIGSNGFVTKKKVLKRVNSKNYVI